MELKRIARMHNELIETVKGWYLREYPEDDLGRELPPTRRFIDFVDALANGEDVYKLMGSADDSIIRERIFEKLSQILGVDYSAIYDAWLSIEENE